MRLVCSECRKSYDYDVDDFCPRCGAYNQPPKAASTAVVRKDGVNEANHKGSFVHKEVHKEKAQRRAVRQIAQPLKGSNQPRKAKSSSSSTVLIVILIIIAALLRFFFLSW